MQFIVLRHFGSLRLMKLMMGINSAAASTVAAPFYCTKELSFDQLPGSAQRLFHHVESRTAVVSFSYRFGKRIAALRSRSAASEEERRRAQ
ncbi:hypothetical protein HH214_09205 [Mucilaginibacter robiniae]|uniref:Secreted protein n=1 Tax=Mucilaginibacter robiniae TaxID=2728022 RepID=A0A7L5DY67_9SPHI|nr:hypothetical protein [Mucilaginibacter robiniae]QJD96040.1 hypothetical protein HH214_09205 [Mucilaginibacter robiniae]